MLNQLSH